LEGNLGYRNAGILASRVKPSEFRTQFLDYAIITEILYNFKAFYWNKQLAIK
jgi:hypothetical protein